MNKNCDGKKIDRCKDCDYMFVEKVKLFGNIPAGKIKCKNYKVGDDYAIVYSYMRDFIAQDCIPKWCPLEDYKE